MLPGITATKEESPASICAAPAEGYNYKPLPTDFLQWQSEARIELFSRLKTQGSAAIRTQPAHLPVMATTAKGAFPANMTTKGVGLVPRSNLLEHFTTVFVEARNETLGQPFSDSLPQRVEAAQTFYGSVKNFDVLQLGGLEIFEGKTAHNIRENPRASLLYTGEAPHYPSYQFNVVVSVISTNSPYYHFLRAARELFAFDAFHIPQTSYPFGYLFRIAEVLDKTPYPRR